jgi:glycosyltransferase involved in cell wall biosynthesis
MDMRDPWSDELALPDGYDRDTWAPVARQQEARCIHEARLVVVTSTAHERLQLTKYPELRGRTLTIMNGADSDPLPSAHPSNCFRIVFAGTIYLGRDPRPFFRAARMVIEQAGASPSDFAIDFVGTDSYEGTSLPLVARREGLADHFSAHGFQPRRRVLEMLAEATMLLSLPLRTTMTLPAKLFEYTRFDAWLLVLAETGSATAELLTGTDADVAPPDDAELIASRILRRLEQFRRGERPVALNRNGRFDRASQCALLFDAFEEMTRDRGA